MRNPYSTEYIECGCGQKIRRAGLAAHEKGAAHRQWATEDLLASTGWARCNIVDTWIDLVPVLLLAGFPIRHDPVRPGTIPYTRRWVLDLTRDVLKAMADSALPPSTDAELTAQLLEFLNVWRLNHRDEVMRTWEQSSEHLVGVCTATSAIERACGEIARISVTLPLDLYRKIRALSDEIHTVAFVAGRSSAGLLERHLAHEKRAE